MKIKEGKGNKKLNANEITNNTQHIYKGTSYQLNPSNKLLLTTNEQTEKNTKQEA